MRIYSASQLAAIVGENPYEKASDIFESIWKKENKDSYFTSLKVNNPSRSYQSDQDYLHKALKSPETTEIIKNVEKINDITDKVKMINFLSTSLDATSEKLLKKHIKSKYSTFHGTKNEKSVLQMYSEKTFEDAQKYNAMITYKIDDYVSLRGKIDGVTKNSNGKIQKIIEIKNRTKQLFYDVRMYEMIQIQAYMHMLKVEQADLVEHYKGILNICNVTYDASLFHKTLSKLKIFNNNLSRIIEDQEYQRCYFESEDRNMFIFLENS
jgi:hypothetical protein